jgi:hypothetical protein
MRFHLKLTVIFKIWRISFIYLLRVKQAKSLLKGQQSSLAVGLGERGKSN